MRNLVLRTTDSLGRAHGGFQWPESGRVEAPDWDGGRKVCGGGLHGLLQCRFKNGKWEVVTPAEEVE